MGDAAAQAIIDEREKNGQYKDIFDFVQRVNLSAVNSKALESLVLSGAFDGFKIKRESFFARNPDGRTFLETLMRYGQVYQQEKNESRQSLFGAMEEVEIATPAIPQAESWSAIEKLNRERDLVGIYLSAHPLDEFEFILKNLCNTQCQELNDRIELSKKQEVVLGGIVTAVEANTPRPANRAALSPLKTSTARANLPCSARSGASGAECLSKAARSWSRHSLCSASATAT